MEPLSNTDPVQAAVAHAAAIEVTRAQQQASVVEILNNKFAEILINIAVLQNTQEGTNEHLRILNGKVAKHEESLTTLMLWKAEAKGFVGAISVGWTTAITLLSGAAGAILIWLLKR